MKNTLIILLVAVGALTLTACSSRKEIRLEENRGSSQGAQILD